MKTITLLTMICLMIQFKGAAQNFPAGFEPYQHPAFQPRQKTVMPDGNLKPVYYNFSKRQLFYNSYTRINGNDFLNFCRNINDPAIQDQIARYDQLTKRKKLLVGATIFCGVAGYITTVASAMVPSNQGGPTPYLLTGLACLLATPILAISTSVPHQKRKEVIFRDLPEAYNFYVVNTK